MDLVNKHFSVGISELTGAVTQISHPDDEHGMNWICDPARDPWFPVCLGWGLGHVATPGSIAPPRWQIPHRLRGTARSIRAVYLVGDLRITIQRRLNGERFEEQYIFTNSGRSEKQVWGIGLNVPWNDNYPDAQTCVTQRCHAHVWAGGNIAYVCGMRMGGKEPHLGLVVTEGFFGGYSIEGRGLLRGGSNLRGALVLNAKGFTLKPGQTHRIAWTLFWHRGWLDFLKQASDLIGETIPSARHYVLTGNEAPQIHVGPRARAGHFEDGRVLIDLRPGRQTWICMHRIPDVEKLVRARVRMIHRKQQFRKPGHALHGALLPYNNDLGTMHYNPEWIDQGEGRERLAMGVLLAQSLRRHNDSRVRAALKLYHRFVRNKLQQPNGRVLNSVGDLETWRMYNFPWVAHFHLEMYKSFGDRQFLDDCYKTHLAFYQHDGHKFYAIGIPMLDTMDALNRAGLVRQANLLRRHFLRHADHVASVELNMPPHEVNYEQTIVGPAVHILLECHLLDGKRGYLEKAKSMMPALEAFGGRQPDHHLHDIAIRHWDGFWFSAKGRWGDTMPQYWSALTGWVFYRYWQVTGDVAYRDRGREILLGNLSAFKPDGSASCAYMYPDAVNGDPARFWDPLANDQDWAMVFLLQAVELDPSFTAERWGGRRA